MMQTILAFDTSTEALSVALKHGDHLESRFELAPRLHAQKILPLIDALLSAQGIDVRAVDAFVFGRGPGAFTGVRTAIGVVQGLALAYDKPCLGISTLLAMAEGARRELGQRHVMPCLDARMGEVYAGAWRFDGMDWQCTLAERVCAPGLCPAPAAAEPLHGCGSGWAVYAAELSAAAGPLASIAADVRYPQALDMLQLALPRLARGEGVPAELAAPVYLRDKVAEKSRR
jgi:tRNA threonylcarbamoyladenosine biosynthesis protein TsaB